MTPTPPSNLPATRLHMARMRRAFAPKPRNTMQGPDDPCCKGCGQKVYCFKYGQIQRCINQSCELYMKAV